MFTGLIEEVGKIKSIQRSGQSMILSIEAKEILKECALGDSIAVNGICLTATSLGTSSFTLDVMPETMARTNLNQLSIGSVVNLERAMTPNRRFGGHFVAGHVDGVAKLSERKEMENTIFLTFHAEPSLTKYMIEKGSIAIDGISLTLIEVNPQSFSVSIIPHTLKNTNLFSKQIGSTVNIEVDMIGKFVEKYISNFLGVREKKGSTITEGFLRENGFLE
ncbi:riboflavin synthase [Tepidibacillus marianensis]|uniref:riboflavin synthase n=1 Tax=Tepidibacillus marianensis TaxID=3131995 RepID=UPI0030D3181A